MAYPITIIPTTHVDSASDAGDPAAFRSDAKALIEGYNDMRVHLLPVSGRLADWYTVAGYDSVAGMLGWRNYGNGHVIFDGSAGISPSGTLIYSTSNAENPWTPSYGVLMGWDGVHTYGVRVDSARLADLANQAYNSLDSLGIAQTWTAFTGGTRVFGVTYYAPAGRPIMVRVTFYSTTAGPATYTAYVNGALAGRVSSASNASDATLQFIVPPGEPYFVVYEAGATASLLLWTELR